MTQDEIWLARYNDVVSFIKTNRRNPSKYIPEERGNFLNWLKANRKAMNAGRMKPEREVLFGELMELVESHRRKNQYE